MDAEKLAAFLGRQRWFAGKGRSWHLGRRTTLGWLRRELPAVRIDVQTVVYDDGEFEHYQMPLAHLPEPVEQFSHAFIGDDAETLETRTYVYDALHIKDVTGLWLQAIAADEEHGDLRFRLDPTATAVPVDAPSLVSTAEQSNTSLIYGAEAILKVFRRLSPGLNPDIEIHTALARAGSTHIAAPLGWVEGTWQDPELGTVEGSLAMLQQFLRNGADGWDLAKASVRDLFGERDLHADEVGGDFAGESFRLGLATAEVHSDLARTLPTKTVGSAHLGELATAMHRRLDRAVADVPELGSYAADLRSTYDGLRGLDQPVLLQRVHGDYHLGQVMRTLDGWKLLDFEGEPVKSLVERRQLDSPMRDVAGMLRSFDYVARHMLVDGRSDPQREYRAVEWSERNRDAFCDGYAKGSGVDPRVEELLLAAYEADKAVYEVVYEARHRPSWLRIPFAAIARLAQDARGRTS
jgi:maltokinase